MTVSVQGSDGQTVLFQTRKVKASDLETDSTLLDLDDIPMPTGITDSNNATYSNFSAFVTDLPNNSAVQGPEGPQGPAIDAVTLSQSVDQTTVTMGFTYQKNNQTFSIASNPTFTIPAGPTGPTGTGIQFVSHDSQNNTITFQFTDTLSDLTVNLPQGDTGPAGRGISSISKSGDVMTINFDDGSSPTQLSGITGPQGDKGDTGASITDVSYDNATDTLTITYADVPASSPTGKVLNVTYYSTEAQPGPNFTDTNTRFTTTYTTSSPYQAVYDVLDDTFTVNKISSTSKLIFDYTYHFAFTAWEKYYGQYGQQLGNSDEVDLGVDGVFSATIFKLNGSIYSSSYTWGDEEEYLYESPYQDMDDITLSTRKRIWNFQKRITKHGISEVTNLTQTGNLTVTVKLNGRKEGSSSSSGNVLVGRKVYAIDVTVTEVEV